MFAHIFTYRLKCLLRDRTTIFWTMLFPLLLGTFFYLAFSNLTTREIFQPIDVAVVDNSAWMDNESFKQVLKDVSTGEDRLFNLTITSADKAAKLLLDKNIAGYITVDKPIKIVVGRSGLEQSIIKSFIDNYMQSYSAFESIIIENPTKIQLLIDNVNNHRTYVQEAILPGGKPDFIVNYFYSLLAMACFYGGFMGMREINDVQANISNVAARVNIAPVHKMKFFFSSSAASLLVQFTQMLLLLVYITFVLKISFGSRIGYVLLTTFIGSIAGLSFGAFVSVLVKKSEAVKTGILISVTMLCSFFAGMMQENVKYLISRKVPLLSWINPVNLLTDAFYSLYYYDTMTRYKLNMVFLLVFTLLFCSVTYSIIRRRKYASL